MVTLMIYQQITKTWACYEGVWACSEERRILGPFVGFSFLEVRPCRAAAAVQKRYIESDKISSIQEHVTHPVRMVLILWEIAGVPRSWVFSAGVDVLT